MRRWIDPLPFGRKLIWAMTLTSVSAVVVVCAVLTTVGFLTVRRMETDNLTSQARLVALRSAAAVYFDRPDEAAELLGALVAVPDVAAATVYDAAGQPFAHYARPRGLAPDFSPGPTGSRTTDHWLIQTEPVVYRGEPAGKLMVVYDLAALRRKALWNAAASLVGGAAATGVAFVVALWLQRLLYKPIAALSAAAAVVTRTGDYSVRADRFNDDELGRLTDAFNDMLEQIQRRDAGLEQARQALAQVNQELRLRNDEMQQFVHTVSHDLKAPLVTMLGFAALMRDDLKQGRTAELDDAAKRIETGGRKMDRLINDLLKLSRAGRARNESEEIDTAALVREIWEGLAVQVQEAGVTVDVRSGMPRLFMDRTRLTQVFENLLTNAIKYGCEGESKRVEVGGSQGPGGVDFYVRDFGPGIPREHHEHVFGLFHRLRKDERGSGVGLAIAARVVQVHGGRIWVESEPGHGATFRFTLPPILLAGAPEAAARKPEAGEPCNPSVLMSTSDL